MSAIYNLMFLSPATDITINLLVPPFFELQSKLSRDQPHFDQIVLYAELFDDIYYPYHFNWWIGY